ncbi:hypothetical protein GC207_10620 [bacterium]|nr:hypothetical protein [bacterium]
MGVTEESTPHCRWHPGFTPAPEAYLDKFLLGKKDVDTDVLRSKFTNVDRAKWILWTAPVLN